MKTLTTILAIAVMVFAFNTNPVMAKTNIWGWEEAFDEYEEKVRKGEYKNAEKIDELEDLDQPDGERAVADSGEESSTSAASADDE